eukprot:TRINITY_DN1918_c0_g1_i2.p1 TRINITY_DN1918_c0_g1~~TRINITY_DN1918_c0_g1_i2.p1  ORF type:complete len:252 (-),score=54.17 TRINITY_DN1918_c0_g1_i2:136-891(-)
MSSQPSSSSSSSVPSSSSSNPQNANPQNDANAKPPNTTPNTIIPPKEELPDKPPKVRGHCCLYFAAALVRLVCIIAGFAELGYGGWICYQEKNYKGFTSDSLLNGIQGIFLLLAGLAILFAEFRNRWTTKRTVKVFVFLESWGGRGVFYLILGALNIPIKVKVMNISYATGLEFGGLTALGGLLSISLFPFFYNLGRRRDEVKQIWETKRSELEGVVVVEDDKPRDLNSGRTMFDPKLANLGSNELPPEEA